MASESRGNPEDAAALSRVKYACRLCRTRKIKCDGVKPKCGTCVAHERHCEYDGERPQRRLRVPGSRRAEQERRRQLRSGQHGASENDISRPALSTSGSSPVERRPQNDQVVPYQTWTPGYSHSTASEPPHHEDEVDVQNQVDVVEHLAVDLSGNIEARGPTNTLYESRSQHGSRNLGVPEAYASATLTANAALERQRESMYRQSILERGNIEGVPAELALHLLDIHWSRHHFFLLTYRPAFYRDMATGGPYYSPLLLFAILAVSSRYSERPEVGGDHSVQSGKDFYARARELLFEDMEKSSIPTATALMLMGNALVSAGQIDRGWLYTGMGIRMIINLGLHIDAGNRTTAGSGRSTLEDVEIRRRLFWGAFVSEKLQSLYLGRPFFIHESDTHVPKRFLDVYEEEEIWKPMPDLDGQLPIMATNSVSNFTHQCVLAEICGDIMSSFYAVKAQKRPRSSLYSSRDSIRQKLSRWIANLPGALRFIPWDVSTQRKIAPIHIIVLHTVYYSLQILLERPFVADGHLNSKDQQDVGSWGECTIAAEKISHLLCSYRQSYTFRRIPYQLCYTTYVASTILVRNANNANDISASVKHLAVCLKAFEEMKLAHPGSSRMESRIRDLMSRLGVNVDDQLEESISGVSPSSDRLPNPDFDTSNIDAIQNRNIDINAIRQSFTQGPSQRSYAVMPSNVGLGIEGPIRDMYHFPLAEPPVMGQATDLPVDLSYANAQVSGGDGTDINWDFRDGNFSGDLLFGASGNNWL